MSSSALQTSSTGTRRDAKIVKRHADWKPSIMAFLLPFVGLLSFGLWVYQPNPSPLGWALSVIWSLPAIGVMVGFQGVLLIRRRLRRAHEMTPAAPVEEDVLIVLVPTIGRHDTYPALERSVLSYVEHLPAFFPHIRVDVLTEEGCEAAARIDALADTSPLIRVVTVPKAYETANGTRFKARANHYAHELRIEEGEALDDVWVLHMDDDTGVGPDTAAAAAQFINRQRRAGDEAKHMAQGILAYPRENAVNMFTWLADAVRPADDIARFRAFTGLGTPVAGVHGELLLLRASIEATIGWDFGPKAIVEDAQLALTFCRKYPGRSDWFNGRCYGASPANSRDFIKQRERWAWGLVALCFNRTVPFRYRWFLMLCMVSWVLGPLQHVSTVLLVAWLIGDFNTSPVTQSVVVMWSLSFAYVIWTYWEGLRLNALVSLDGKRRWWEPLAVLALIPVFSVMEGLGGLRGLIKFIKREENKFVVIAKPA
ncbi:glycosyltransferase family 2 protein [Streptomyces sp. NBC_00503]|uniref:glycosyltransferase family 2 protein n=1 Tax=Streptomyces sp. NBC_00503 TaxID=2903659 RepID=UPI002E8135C6|nr:glycosyltransferase family 2 protein [Streptomyces sp. NBC_00503]WUD79404.1 glycosyltransferase family 2 protein [Streptomyces sp. NBC_00503]